MLTEGAPVYFWKDGAVVVRPWQCDMAWFLDVRGIPSVDAQETHPEMRYGVFNVNGGGWRHTPIANFPPEFRAHLLLLGVA